MRPDQSPQKQPCVQARTLPTGRAAGGLGGKVGVTLIVCMMSESATPRRRRACLVVGGALFVATCVSSLFAWAQRDAIAVWYHVRRVRRGTMFYRVTSRWEGSRPINALREYPDRAVPALIALLEDNRDDGNLCFEAIRILAQFKDRRAVPCLRSFALRTDRYRWPPHVHSIGIGFGGGSLGRYATILADRIENGETQGVSWDFVAPEPAGKPAPPTQPSPGPKSR